MNDHEEIDIVSDTGRFALVPEWLLLTSASDAAIRVYAIMAARWADRGDNTCWPSRATIAATVGCSVDKIDRAIGQLVKVGAIEVIHRANETGAQTSNGYRLIRVMDGGRKNAAPVSRKNAEGEGRKNAAGGAAKMRHKPESSTQNQKELSSSPVSDGRPADEARAKEIERAEKFCRWFIDQIRTADPEARLPAPDRLPKAWVTEADRLFRLDGRDPATVREVVEWIYRHPDGAFWIANCRCPETLRRQFDKINARRRNSRPATIATPVPRGTQQPGRIKL